MGRRQTDSDLHRFTLCVLFLIAAISCCMAYYSFSVSLKGNSDTIFVGSSESWRGNEEEREGDGCCRGVEHLELWGDAMKWGSDFKLNSSEECCRACKEMCEGDDGPCLCDSWVFCGNKQDCGSRFGECWLKKQKDTLDPDWRDSGDKVIWTSGLVFGKGEGIIKLKTEHGIVNVNLFPDCAPHSVYYILELLSLQHCAGCQFYRAESRGNSWDLQGNHIEHAPYGPPYALIQGTVDAYGTVFKDIPQEVCPPIRRGSIAWVGSGPDFFISLANHHEWKKAYTVFGQVLPEDMEIVEKISQLPTIPDVWSNVKVAVLERPVPLRFIRMKKSP
ncbi:Peptidyl-prolyl cis-trans isomerase [Gossypium australe]|uniref:Peptidyl-prolyl cis-trans isomerase n=1 Tax=Gossypium australe TaxID=47621 RepID=A0A5B6W0L5_9ROSI|nr:Peptidyl-prolyl cis-trans isomerase [Gossypium australe]